MEKAIIKTIRTVGLRKALPTMLLRQKVCNHVFIFSWQDGASAVQELAIHLQQGPQSRKHFIRITDPGSHRTLVNGSVRPADFNIDNNETRVKADRTKELSFATSMKKLKSIIKSKSRFFSDINIYSIDEFVRLPDGLQFIKDRPGHVSLVVTKDMETKALIEKLEVVARSME